MDTDTPRLMLFAKAPVLGRVKTRLQAVLGEEGCLRLHRQLLRWCLQRATDSGLAVELWSDHCNEEMRDVAQRAGVSLYQQEGDDLGRRMANAFAAAFDAGAERVLVAGADCPFIESAHYRDAADLLRNNDVVITPAADGGYVMLGQRQSPAALFAGPTWGSSLVLDETLALARDQSLSVRIRGMSHDIDRPDDLALLRSFREFDWISNKNNML